MTHSAACYMKLSFDTLPDQVETVASFFNNLPTERQQSFLSKVAKCFINNTDRRLSDTNWQRLERALSSITQTMLQAKIAERQVLLYINLIEETARRQIQGLPQAITPVTLYGHGNLQFVTSQSSCAADESRSIDLRNLDSKTAKAILLYLKQDEHFIEHVGHDNCSALLQFADRHNLPALHDACMRISDMVHSRASCMVAGSCR